MLGVRRTTRPSNEITNGANLTRRQTHFDFLCRHTMSVREEALKSLFIDVFQQVTKRQMKPDIHVVFYPFAGLNHTIRIRMQRVYVRLSDILRDPPRQVHQALAFILVAKLFNKRVTWEY